MAMYSPSGTAVLPAVGFPIRESTDHCLFSGSPWLIAAVHALHRLLVPRHPPCALHILTVIRRSLDPRVARRLVIPVFHWQNCAVFKVREKARPGLGPGLSKLNSMRRTSIPSEQARGHRRSSAPRSGRHFGSRFSSGGTVCAAGVHDRSNPGASLERR